MNSGPWQPGYDDVHLSFLNDKRSAKTIAGSCKGSSDLEVKGSQHLSVGRSDIDAPIATISVSRNTLGTPRPPIGGPDIQGDITDDLPFKKINMPDLGWNLIGFNLAPHKNPLDRYGKRGTDTGRHAVFNF